MKSLYLRIIALLSSGISFSQTTVKKIAMLSLLVLWASIVNAQSIDNAKIKSISQNWANSHNLNSKIINIICKTIEDEPLLYIVNFEKGWVMISADESLRPILGFSFESNYSEQNEAEAIKSLFKFYSSEKDANIAHNIKFAHERELLLSGSLKSNKNIEEVKPLLPITWAQLWPYNAYCPLDDDPNFGPSFNGHHNTSCGPTAFAQILRYWRYPVHGTGYHSYTYDNPGFALLGFVEADYESTYYNWDNMPSSLNFNDPEPIYTDIATLMQNVGVSVDGSWASGGHLYQYTAAAVKYFDYLPTCEAIYRNDFTSEEWHAIYKNELINGRPIMMVGPGHYFVCDGYYGADFYHINWGWGPGSDGYYPLYALGDYSANNWALVGLEPNYQNKKLIMNDPYTVDDSTIVLLHFDGDLTNQSSLSANPNEHGTIEFADNSELGLGQCLHLDNSSQGNRSFLDIADNNNLDLSGDWTIEMWFKPMSLGTNWYENFTLLNKPGDNNIFESNYSIYMFPTSHYISNALNFSYYPSGEPEHYRTSMNADKDFLELGKWYHLTFIRKTSNNTIKMLIHNSDRELIYYASSPTETSALPLVNSNPLFIGSSNQSNTYFDGYIDELRISNIVREFEIKGTGLTLVTPNGGEKWQQATTQQISWDGGTNDVKIEYSSDHEQSWHEIIASTLASTGFYNWTLPEINSDYCKIKITEVSDINVYDKSDGVFSISPYELSLIPPNGNNFYVPGASMLISWKSTPVANIKIEYTINNGNSWLEIEARVDASLGFYNWTIPNTISTQCKIRITDLADATVFAESDNSFEIRTEIITPIYDIQYTTVPGADGTYPSLLNGEELTVTGIVTATGYLGHNNDFFISEPGVGSWGGIFIYKSNVNPNIGDEVKVIGTVTEYTGFTEITNPSVSIISSGNVIPDPIIINTSDLISAAKGEQFEGCLVKVENVTVSQDPDEYNQAYIDDGTGECQIDDPIFPYSVSLGDQFKSIIGVVDYKYNKYRLLPRLESDLSIGTGTPNNIGGPYTVDDNTVLLLHFDGDLTNNSALSGDGVQHGNGISFIANTLSYLGQSLNLNGSSYVSIPHNPNLNLNGDWTIEAWIKVTAFNSGTQSIIVRKPGDSDDYNANYNLELHPWWGNVLNGFYFSDDATRINVTEMSPTINQWYHVAFIRNTSNSKISIVVHDENGDEVSSSSQNYASNDVLFSSKDLRIGEAFDGYMDELRISNVVRSFENTTGVPETDFGNLISIYPNPAGQIVNISTPETVDLAIFNLTGQKIMEKKAFSSGNIDVSTFKRGIYVIRFSCNKGVVSRKLIIE